MNEVEFIILYVFFDCRDMAYNSRLIIICLIFLFHLTIAQLERESSSCPYSDDEFPLVFPSTYTFQLQASDFWTYDRAGSAWKMISFTNLFSSGGVGAGAADEDGTSAEPEAAEVCRTEEERKFLDRRVSMIKFTETSLWISGHSGSLYERFWNGLRWVTIPHDLPGSAGLAAGIYSVNQTLLALSEAGELYQLQADTNGQLQWLSSGPSAVLKKAVPLTSNEPTSLFFTAADGWLAELSSVHPVMWTNHGQPRGGDVAHVVDAGSFRAGLVFTVSSEGDLYEYEPTCKPAWKKHIRKGSPVEELAPVSGVAVHELAGARSFSLFLMTKSGFLAERRLAQAKWRWLLHPKPDSRLSFSLGPVLSTLKNISFFFVSEQGSVHEYTLPYLHGSMRSSNAALQNGCWKNHLQPETRVMPSVPGVVMNSERIFFMLEDGRLGELHNLGYGGVDVSPLSRPATTAKNYHKKLVWSVHEAPESEGGNADYCTTALEPSNCLEGIDDGSGQMINTLDHAEQEKSLRSSSESRRWREPASSLFRARTLQFGKSIFLLGEDGVPSERFFNGKLWLWLKHDISSATSASSIAGILGIYNGSVFMNDVEGNLMTREWTGNDLHWLNCTALQGGVKVVSGSPSDGLLGEARTVTLDDAQFFVSQHGELLEFMVALRNFTWRNCGRPPGASVSAIVDQEVFRYRVVFVVGSDGKLYHFNRITRLWHGYRQPEHLTLSGIPGTVYRPSFQSTAGSLFMRSESGDLVEFRWDGKNGWSWSEHGTPDEHSYVATSPGPCMDNGNVLVVGSDGRVHARQLVDGKWSWQDFGHPLAEHIQSGRKVYVVEQAEDGEVFLSFEGECDPLIDKVRPLALNKDLAAFLLRDGRMAELKQVDEGWEWISIIDTPTSRCHSNYWTATNHS